MKHLVWATVTAAAFLLGWGLGAGLLPDDDGAAARLLRQVLVDAAPSPSGGPSATPADGGSPLAVASAGAGPADPSPSTVPEDWAEALTRLDEVARQGDRDAAEALRRTLLGRVLDLGREGDVHLARERLAAYLTHNPHDPEAYLLESDLLQMQGRSREAVDPLMALLGFADDPAMVSRARDKLALLVKATEAQLANTGNVPALVRFFEDLALRDPVFDGHRLRLAHWQLRAGRIDDAERTLAETGTVGVDPEAREDLVEQARVARVSLPLERRDGALHVTARMAGRPLRMLVDTGATMTVLTRSGVAGLGATASGNRVRVRTAGGVVTSEVHHVADVQIGALELDTLPVLVLEGPLPQGVDGLLGMDVLSRFPDVTGAAGVGAAAGADGS